MKWLDNIFKSVGKTYLSIKNYKPNKKVKVINQEGKEEELDLTPPDWLNFRFVMRLIKIGIFLMIAYFIFQQVNDLATQTQQATANVSSSGLESTTMLISLFPIGMVVVVIGFCIIFLSRMLRWDSL